MNEIRTISLFSNIYLERFVILQLLFKPMDGDVTRTHSPLSYQGRRLLVSSASVVKLLRRIRSVTRASLLGFSSRLFIDNLTHHIPQPES